MNATAPHKAIDVLEPLARRIRWQRLTTRMRFGFWVLAAMFVALFAADMTFGIRTLGLRIASLSMLVFASAGLTIVWFRTWTASLDKVGLAQLLEKRFPELAERLLTLAQLDESQAQSKLAALLESQATRQLAGVNPAEAFPQRQRAGWFVSGAALTALVLCMVFVPALGNFTYRLTHAWTTPLTPFAIHLSRTPHHVLRGASVPIDAVLEVIDERAELPGACDLICEYESGFVVTIPMSPTATGFTARLDDIRQAMTCRAEADGVASEPFAIFVVASPAFVDAPTFDVTPPSYVPIRNARKPDDSILCFSRLRLGFELDRTPARAEVCIVRDDAAPFMVPVQWQEGSHKAAIDVIAKQSGKYRAQLALTLEHDLNVTLPLAQWAVYDDQPPRFVEPPRLREARGLTKSADEYAIAPDDLVRVQAVLEDDEGLGAILLEQRVNGGPVKSERWLHGGGKRSLAIDHWLPLPKGLKADDRVQVRLRAFDNRQLKKGELANGAEVVPERDLSPQETVAPGDEKWLTLRVDPRIGNFVKDQVQAQSDDVSDLIAKIKKKLQSELEQVQQLQRAIHLQTALLPAQASQAIKLLKLNSEIVVDLNQAGDRFVANPALAVLAMHFYDIADVEMKTSGDALERFLEKDRALPEAEKELPTASDALMRALKKLERMVDWNDLVAQNRLDQFQIEKLQKRQEELAQRLENVREQPLSDAELANEIEAIRAEQAKLAAETAGLEQKSRLVQDSLAALEQARTQRLAQEAEKLAAEQRALSTLDPATMPAAIKERLGELAKRQADLGTRVQPFAKSNQGPNVEPAANAARALEQAKIDNAIQAQKEHESRLGDWLSKLLPGALVNKTRERMLELAKTQKSIRDDLEKLGQDLVRLDEKMLADRLKSLVKRQRDLHAEIAKLPIERKDVAAIKANAQNTAKTAADQLAAKEALLSHESMEQAKQQLESLAAALPQSLPADRAKIKDAAERAKIEQVERFEKEQLALRQETERLLADWLKSSASAKNPLAEKMAKLAGELMELSQKGSSPEAKAMAKESLQMLDDAKKSMDASQAMKANGDADAKKMDADAAQKLEFAVKQLAKLTQDQAMKNPPKEDAQKTAEALAQSQKAMQQAERDLPKLPKDAQMAMKLAAEKLADAANQASKQAAKSLPNPPARNPAARAPLGGKGAAALAILKNAKLDESIGKTWGELPGELKTQMLQDFRARFGEDYAEIIRQYFDRLADVEPQRRSPPK